jgi:hypothetical protein
MGSVVMKYTLSWIPVDIASIFVCDKQFLVENGAKFKKINGRMIKKQPGTYNVDIKPIPVKCETKKDQLIENTACEKMRTKGKIVVESGVVFVGDPCYYFNRENWHKFINKYWNNDKFRLAKLPKSAMQLKLDADGIWGVELELTRVTNTRKSVPKKRIRRFVHNGRTYCDDGFEVYEDSTSCDKEEYNARDPRYKDDW